MRKVMLKLRYFIIRKLIGKMPVIANCTIEETIVEINFLDKIKYMCYNNTIKRARYHYQEKEVKQDNTGYGKVVRNGNTFALKF